MTSKQLKPPCPGTVSVNVRLPIELRDFILNAQAARRITEKTSTKRSKFYIEAIELYRQHIDITTGLPRKWADAAAPPADTPAIGAPPSVLIPSNLPLIHHSLDTNQFDSDASLHAALDGSPLMAWAAGPLPDCTHVNPPLIRYTGQPVSAFLGSRWAELVHPEDRNRILADVLYARGSRQPFRHAYRMRRADNSWAWVVDVGEPRYLPDGAFAGYVGTLHHIAPDGDRMEVLIYRAGHATRCDAVVVPGDQELITVGSTTVHD